jgi:hypothetical protein
MALFASSFSNFFAINLKLGPAGAGGTKKEIEKISISVNL